MTKLLIVDDEEKTRTSIRNIIDWKSNEIDVIGEAENGMAAFDMISDNCPDILLTDIRMPVMDGLKLIERIFSCQLPIKSIIMSGYDDFYYAQRALKFGVSDYLLKPSRPKKILDAVLKVKAIIENESKKKAMHENLKIQFQESLPLLKDKYLTRLVRSENKNVLNINQKLKLFNTSMDCAFSAVAVVRMDEPLSLQGELGNEDFELMKFAIKNITAETIGSFFKHETFENNDDIIAILKLENKFDNPAMKTMLEGVKENIRKFLNFSVSIGLGRCYRGIDAVSFSYHEAMKVLEARSFHGMGQTILYDEVMDEDMTEMSYPIHREMEVLNCLKSGNLKQLEASLKEFFTDLKVESTSKSNVLNSVLALLFAIYHLCIEMNIETDEIFGSNFLVLEDILKLKNILLIESRLFVVSNKVIAVITSRKNNNRILEQAVKFIRENFNKNLSREIVAREVYIAPGYLSILFRQEMGLNFLDFLHKTRIENACEMLKESALRTYEIALRTGYADEKYFFQVFKKYTGMTPSRYRELYKK